MFIKILNNPLYSEIGYTIIDNVDIIDYFSEAPLQITSVNQAAVIYRSIMNGSEYIFDTDLLHNLENHFDNLKKESIPSKENPYLYNLIIFRKKGQKLEEGTYWYLDTKAYIMSNDGKTIEKVHGGGFIKTLK